MPTTWYNYTAASAGTIINKNISDTAGNLNTAVESVCPKGWSLPFYKQIDSSRSASKFSPVLGGYYTNSSLRDESAHSYWWGSEAYIGTARYRMNNDAGNLYTGYGSRYAGFYIRCVSEEKTVTDLTYMQDMTPQIAPASSLCI